MLEALNAKFPYNTPIFAQINDCRITFFQYFLQLAIVIYVIINVFAVGGDQVVVKPEGKVFYWGDEGNYKSEITSYKNGLKAFPQYCSNPLNNYNYGGQWTYYMFKCLTLPLNEMSLKGETQMFFLTSFDETYITKTKCNNNNNNYCMPYDEATSLGWELIKTNGDTECECNQKQNYYALGVEDMKFSVTHSMTAYHNGVTSVESDFSKMTTYIQNSNGDIIYTKDGTDPNIRSVTLTIREWLDLAGVTLDTVNELAAQSEEASWVCGNNATCAEGVNPGAILRTTGVTLNLELSFTGDKYHQECTIKVKADQGWNSLGGQGYYIDSPTYPTAWNNVIDYNSTMIYKYSYGVKFKFNIKGSIALYDFQTLQNNIIAGFMYMSIVPIIVIYVVMNCCANSDIYKTQIHDEGRESIRDQILSRKEQKNMVLQLNQTLSPTSPTKKIEILDKNVWLKMATTEGISNDEKALWPFEDNLVSSQKLIQETEANPDTVFALTVKSITKKVEELGNKYYITVQSKFADYSYLNGMYECISKEPLKYRSDTGKGELTAENATNNNKVHYKLFYIVPNNRSLVATYTASEYMLSFPIGRTVWDKVPFVNNGFCRIHVNITPQYKQKATTDVCLEIFQKFDKTNQDGVITKEEFLKISQTWKGELVNDVDEIWTEMDKNGDGVVQINELIEYLTPAVTKYPGVQGLSSVIKNAHDLKRFKEKWAHIEERFDAKSKQAFYINHKTKETTWIDPRKKNTFLSTKPPMYENFQNVQPNTNQNNNISVELEPMQPSFI